MSRAAHLVSGWLGLVLFLVGAARADVAPPPLQKAAPKPPAPQEPTVCVPKTEERYGPRGPYSEVTGAVRSVRLRLLEVQPAAERRAVVRWQAGPEAPLRFCYRWQAPPLAPVASVITLSALFLPGGSLDNLVVLSADPRLDADCLKAELGKREKLVVSGKLPVRARLEVTFAVRCATVTCPHGATSGSGASYGRPHELCN